ncbi:thiamine phosphate synthase [Mesorhizobium sp. C268A]|uniref:thiamine phosphate synthase n=1 Tax=Mesorhizobium sp. C268A TaxID=2956826 RepID=UPI001FD8C9EE|nr:thiamine phosphate synthase [Mesorhizobium sp. LSJC268A00]
MQLRIKDMDEKGLQTEIRRANDACAVHGCQVSVNDYWRTAIEEGCDFVHLGQKDLAAADADDEIRRIEARPFDPRSHRTAPVAEPEYVALGPVYPTSLKKMNGRRKGSSGSASGSTRSRRSHWSPSTAST